MFDKIQVIGCCISSYHFYHVYKAKFTAEIKEQEAENMTYRLFFALIGRSVSQLSNGVKSCYNHCVGLFLQSRAHLAKQGFASLIPNVVSCRTNFCWVFLYGDVDSRWFD